MFLTPGTRLIWVMVAVGEVALKAGVEVWNYFLWIHYYSGIPHTGTCSQTWTAGTAGPPVHLVMSLACQKCPDIRLTAFHLLRHAH